MDDFKEDWTRDRSDLKRKQGFKSFDLWSRYFLIVFFFQILDPDQQIILTDDQAMRRPYHL